MQWQTSSKRDAVAMSDELLSATSLHCLLTCPLTGRRSSTTFARTSLLQPVRPLGGAKALLLHCMDLCCKSSAMIAVRPSLFLSNEDYRNKPKPTVLYRAKSCSGRRTRNVPQYWIRSIRPTARLPAAVAPAAAAGGSCFHRAWPPRLMHLRGSTGD
jgi:hypothetical protein